MKNQKIFSYCSSIHKFLYGKAFHNGTVHISWDKGSSLGLILGIDKFEIIKGGESNGE